MADPGTNQSTTTATPQGGEDQALKDRQAQELAAETRKKQKERRRFWATVFIACLYSALTILLDVLVIEKISHVDEVELSAIAWTFPFIPKTNYRALLPTHTVLLELGSEPGEEQINRDLCEYRAHVAEALEHAKTLKPLAVIVDLQFQTNTKCVQDLKLRAAAASLREVAEVFFGTSLNPNNVGEKGVLFPDCEGMTPEDIELAKCKVSPPKGGHVALVELPLDSRKLALAYQDAEGKNFPTLTWLAAKTFDEGEILTKLSAVQYAAKGNMLYHSVLARSTWKDSSRFFHWSGFKARSRDLLGQFLIIGSSEDVESSGESSEATKSVPGYFHQASVLEAILDRRLLVPWGGVFEFVIGFAFWFAIEYWFEGWRRILAAAVGLVALIVLNAMVMLLWGHYGDFAFISTVGLAVIFVEILNRTAHYWRRLFILDGFKAVGARLSKTFARREEKHA